MPKLGNTVEECLLAGWKKNAGDVVAEGEIIAEIETDKATFELAAPVDGTLLATFFEEGDLVPVFANVCVIGTPGENVEQFRPRKRRSRRQTGRQPPVEQAVLPATPASPAGGSRRPRRRDPLQPEGAKVCRGARSSIAGHVAGSGPGGRVLEQDLRALYHDSPRSPRWPRNISRPATNPRAGSGSTA